MKLFGFSLIEFGYKPHIFQSQNLRNKNTNIFRVHGHGQQICAKWCEQHIQIIDILVVTLCISKNNKLKEN